MNLEPSPASVADAAPLPHADDVVTKPERRPIQEVANEAFARAVATYTVGPQNAERVIGLVVDDVMTAIRAVVEAEARTFYVALLASASRVCAHGA